MSNRSILLAAAGVAVLWYMTRGAMNLTRLVFQIAGITQGTVSGGKVNLTLQILIGNPTETAFPLYKTKIYGDVLLNNFAVGQAISQVDMLLLPGQSIVVPLTVSADASNIAGGIAAIIAAIQGNGQQIRFLGTADIAGAKLPVNIQYML